MANLYHKPMLIMLCLAQNISENLRTVSGALIWASFSTLLYSSLIGVDWGMSRDEGLGKIKIRQQIPEGWL